MDYNTSGNITTDDFLAMFGNTSSIYNQLPSQSSPSPYSPNDTLNISSNNDTLLQGVYPSGYTITHIVFASIVVTILMIMIVVGNMLVIIAIATEKSLKNIQNWFIASLAVADFFLGLIIMPFSLANELMGYWIFGNWWCDIHSAMDVLLCTASINNLCLISLDRYWSITKAVEYLKTRTPARAALMIAAVWIISGLICIPPLLGWKVKRDEGQALPQCQLSEDIGYVLYSALGSFYIPSCIMVFVYIRIYFAAKRRARRGIKKIPRKQASEQKVTSFTVSPGKGGTTPMPSVPSASTSKQQQIATIESVPTGQNTRSIPIPIVTCDLASDMSSEACDGDNGNGAQDTLKVSTIAATHSTMSIRSSNGTTTPGGQQSNELQIGGNASTVHNRNRALSVGIDTDMVSEFDPSSSDSGVVSRCAVVKPLKFKLCQPIFGKKHQQKKREAKQLKQQQQEQQKQAQQMNQMHHNLHQTVDTTEIEPVIPKVQKPRDPEKEKRRIARKKEKRATLILGLIMGSFIASWLPFFFLYILKPACKFCVIPESAFAVAFWLGYMNSALNPAIYTIFNKDFRRAFRRILFK